MRASLPPSGLVTPLLLMVMLLKAMYQRRISNDLLTTPGNAIGLAVPGMPMGSPGMEGSHSDPYNVLLIDKKVMQVYIVVTFHLIRENRCSN